MAPPSQFLNKVLCNFNVIGSKQKTSNDREPRAEVSRSLSRVRERQQTLDSIIETDETGYDGTLSNVGNENTSTPYATNASISTGQVHESDFNPLQPPPVFAVPLAPAPKSQNPTYTRASQLLIQEANELLANEYMSDAEREYFFSMLSSFILKKSLDKSYGERMLTKERKEEILQFFIRNQLITPDNVDVLLNSQFYAFDVASVANFSVNGRNAPPSVFSCSSYQPYHPAPVRYNLSASRVGGSAYENSLNPAGVPFPVNRRPLIQNESRATSEPVHINNTASNVFRCVQPSLRLIPDTERPSAPIISNLTASKNQSIPKPNGQFLTSQNQTEVIHQKENVKPVQKRRVPSPVNLPKKRRMANTPKEKTVTEVRKSSRPPAPNDSIGNVSITRSGRVSKPVSRYWDLSK